MDRWHNCKSSNYIILKRQHKYKSSWSEIWKWILRYDTKSASKQRKNSNYIQFRSGQSFNRARLFATPQTAAHQASLFFTNSQSLLKLMSIESVMPSNHLILCRPVLLLPQSFPGSGSFPVDRPFASGGQSIGASASASLLPSDLAAHRKGCGQLQVQPSIPSVFLSKWHNFLRLQNSVVSGLVSCYF